MPTANMAHRIMEDANVAPPNLEDANMAHPKMKDANMPKGFRVGSLCVGEVDSWAPLQIAFKKLLPFYFLYEIWSWAFDPLPPPSWSERTVRFATPLL